HADIASSELVLQHLPGLAEAASVIGDVQVRNRGTIGGSVAHADPAADFPVILSALEAFFILRGPSGNRTVGAADFFVDFFTTALKENEILTEIRIPLPADGAGSAYVKLGHPASGYVVVSAGVVVSQRAGSCEFARIAVGGLGSGPVRAEAAEAELQGKRLMPQAIVAAAAKVSEGVDVEGDDYASADYKRHVASRYAQRAIEVAAGRAKD
ncbi:MAG TPA: FAD binding domain-containing protein, partial [Terriglobales bacterium]|nr:FAD binding domain-containing protein [Terriglobales bacterium]